MLLSWVPSWVSRVLTINSGMHLSTAAWEVRSYNLCFSTSGSWGAHPFCMDAAADYLKSLADDTIDRGEPLAVTRQVFFHAPLSSFLSLPIRDVVAPFSGFFLDQAQLSGLVFQGMVSKRSIWIRTDFSTLITNVLENGDLFFSGWATPFSDRFSAGPECDAASLWEFAKTKPR